MKRWPFGLLIGVAPMLMSASDNQAPANKPPIDAAVPTKTETITFAVG